MSEFDADWVRNTREGLKVSLACKLQPYEFCVGYDAALRDVLAHHEQPQPSPKYQSMLDNMDTKAIADHVSKHNPLLQPKPNKLDEITRDEGLRHMLIGLIHRMECIEKQVYDKIPERLKELRGERD